MARREWGRAPGSCHVACRHLQRVAQGVGIRRQLGALEQDRSNLWVLGDRLRGNLDDAGRDTWHVDLLALGDRVEAIDVLAAQYVEPSLALGVGDSGR